MFSILSFKMENSSDMTEHSLADVVTPKVNNDFIDDKKVNLGSTIEASATHAFRISRDFVVIDDSQKLGTQLMSVLLNPSIDPGAAKLAQLYEYYDFSEIKLSLEATSPFGTASGSFQTAWITDPANIALGQADEAAKSAALNKVIRQEGSVQVRPRTSAELVIRPAGKRYCFQTTTSDPRLTEFGALVAVLRDPPSTGDNASFAVTISGKINFYRATLQTNAVNSSVRSCISDFQNFEGRIVDGKFGISFDLVSEDSDVRFKKGKILFDKPLKALIVATSGDFTRRGIHTWETAEARALGEKGGKAVYKCWAVIDRLGEISSLTNITLQEKPKNFIASYRGVQ